MSIQSLQHTYQEARKTDNQSVHHAFVQQLLEDTSEAAMEFHYRIMNDPGNTALRPVLEKAYQERGTSAYEFLLPKLGMRIPAFNKANLLHLLGLSGNCDLLRNILPHMADPSKEVRCEAIAAVGWLGDASAICYLKRFLSTERSGYLRGAIVKALQQINQRDNSQQHSIIDLLYHRLTLETDPEALSAIEAALQEMTGIKGGKDMLMKKDNRFKA